jgi:hypothetical protein
MRKDPRAKEAGWDLELSERSGDEKIPAPSGNQIEITQLNPKYFPNRL